jgi:hypothetical protein
MFSKKQIVRNYIFGLFCALILILSVTLTYYVAFYDEEKAAKVVIEKQDEGCGNSSSTYFINSFIFKIMGAFFAGGMLSDGLFIKLGIF